MNQGKQTFINIILAISIVILLILQFTGNKNASSEAKKDTAMTEDDSVEAIFNQPPKSVGELKIAFVNSDSVSKYYDFTKLIEADLLAKQAEAEAKLKGLYGAYEKKQKEVEKGFKIMGDAEKQEKMQELGLMEQNIMQQEQKLSQDLQQLEAEVMNDYVTKTNAFMQNIGKQLGYDYVLSFRLGGQILYANPALDITQEVIVLVNKEYHAALSK